jgi:hypothetical protein
MADHQFQEAGKREKAEEATVLPNYDEVAADSASTIADQRYAYSEDRKIGVTGAVFLILNKMIGTGSKSSTQTVACGLCRVSKLRNAMFPNV